MRHHGNTQFPVTLKHATRQPVCTPEFIFIKSSSSFCSLMAIPFQNVDLWHKLYIFGGFILWCCELTIVFTHLNNQFKMFKTLVTFSKDCAIGYVKSLLSAPFIAYHAWKLVCCPTPNLFLYRQWFQCRRFNKYLNGEIWVWGWREGSSLAPSLTLYLH